MPAALAGRVLAVAGAGVLVLSPPPPLSGMLPGRNGSRALSIAPTTSPWAAAVSPVIRQPGQPGTLSGRLGPAAHLGGQDRATNLTLAGQYSGLPISLTVALGARTRRGRVSCLPFGQVRRG